MRRFGRALGRCSPADADGPAVARDRSSGSHPPPCPSMAERRVGVCTCVSSPSSGARCGLRGFLLVQERERVGLILSRVLRRREEEKRSGSGRGWRDMAAMVVSGVQWPCHQSAAGSGFGVVVVSQEWKLQLGCWEAAAEGGRPDGGAACFGKLVKRAAPVGLHNGTKPSMTKAASSSSRAEMK